MFDSLYVSDVNNRNSKKTLGGCVKANTKRMQAFASKLCLPLPIRQDNVLANDSYVKICSCHRLGPVLTSLQNLSCHVHILCF